MGVGGQRHTLAAWPLGDRPDTQCAGGLVSPRAGLENAENLAPPGFDPRTF
jgi:hypothetical protein